MSDQERISPYNINTISTRQVMRIKKNINLGVLINTILNSLNWRYKNGIVDSKENYKFDLGVKGLNPECDQHVIFPYSHTAESFIKVMIMNIDRNDCQLKKLWLLNKFSLSAL